MYKKIYVLRPYESKVLIARGIMEHPAVKNALENGKIFVGRGTTNAYILEELFKKTGGIPKDFRKQDYVAGQIYPGKKFVCLGVNPGPFFPEYYFDHGVPKKVGNRRKMIAEFGKGDVVIKGGNAIDMNGTVGVFAGAEEDGGTIGSILGPILVKGIILLHPIGLEKLVWTPIEEISSLLGTRNMLSPPEGDPVGMIPMHGQPFTELDAFELLFDVDAVHVGSGGVGGAEGCIAVLITADNEEEISKIDRFMEEIAETPNFTPNVPA